MPTLITCTENSHIEQHDATQGGFVFTTPDKDRAKEMAKEMGAKVQKRTIKLSEFSIVQYFVAQAH